MAGFCLHSYLQVTCMVTWSRTEKQVPIVSCVQWLHIHLSLQGYLQVALLCLVLGWAGAWFGWFGYTSALIASEVLLSFKINTNSWLLSIDYANYAYAACI